MSTVEIAEGVAQAVAYVAYAVAVVILTIPALLIFGVWYAIRDLKNICDDTLKVAR